MLMSVLFLIGVLSDQQPRIHHMEVDPTLKCPFLVMSEAGGSGPVLHWAEKLAAALSSPSFWAAAANNPNNNPNIRAFCIFQLFRVYARSGMTLGQLANVLEGAAWLDERWVHRAIVGGFVPVRGSVLTDSFFVLDIPSHTHQEAIYLSVEGDLSSRELVETLKGKAVQPTLRNTTIVDVRVWR